MLAFIAAPIVMAQNRKKLKEMEALIDEHRGKEMTADEYHALKERLVKIKSGIVADKKAIEYARDLIQLM